MGHCDTNVPVSKKSISATQIRLDPDLARLVKTRRGEYEARVSLSAFVNLLIRDGLAVRTQADSDSGESTFKK